MNDIIVQLPFQGWRIRAMAFRPALQRSPEVLDGVLRFDQALKVQVAQTTACNLRHPLPQRLARWLLMAHDRTDGDELLITQDFLSAMLGTRRASVTLAARALSGADAIRYRRGRILVHDRQRLEEVSCECYALVRRQYRQLLGWPEE